MSKDAKVDTKKGGSRKEMSKDAKVDTKICPFLNQPCIQDKCMINAEMRQMTGGTFRSMNICGFGAMIQMLSEINAKTPLPQARRPELEIPKLVINRG